MTTEEKLLCRFPSDVKGFLVSEAKRFGSSMNSEVVRSIRERMDRMEKELPAQTGE